MAVHQSDRHQDAAMVPLPARGAVAALRAGLRQVAVGVVLVGVLAGIVVPAAATVPGENGKIAFVSDSSGVDQIYLVDPDGANLEQVTSFDDAAPNPLQIGSLAWSPDGRFLAFDGHAGSDPTWSIWTIGADGTDQRYITDGWSPSWSPDGRLIASTMDSVGVVNGLDTTVIATVDLATAEQTILTDPGDWVHSTRPNATTRDHSPAWTPDGREIVFARFTPGSASISNTGIGAVEIATLVVRRAGLNGEGWVGQSVWGIDVTPASQQILASVQNLITSPFTLQIRDLDSFDFASNVSLPAGMGVVGGPSVAPAGDRVALALALLSGSPVSVWTLAPDGSGPVEVVEGRAPAWQPLNPYPMGLVDPATGIWYLRDAAGAVSSFYYGVPGDFPFMGDWDCDGVDTPGLYRQSDGYVYLRNSNTQGIADVTFFFGNPGDIPIAGDFNGDGCDTVSVYRPAQSRVFIINTLGVDGGGLGAAEVDYLFGNPGDSPFTGDFDGDGIDTIGLHRPSTGLVYFRNSHIQGIADTQLLFGDPGDRFTTNDWNGDGKDTPMVYRPANTTHYFRFTNTQGAADAQYIWGDPDWLPVTGTFNNN